MKKSKADKRYEETIEAALEIVDKVYLLLKLLEETVEMYIDEGLKGVSNDKERSIRHTKHVSNLSCKKCCKKRGCMAIHGELSDELS